jgi:cytochrome c553
MQKIISFMLLCFSMIANSAGDVAAGGKKSAVCAACHGVQGIAASPIWPNLAGQHANYLVKQLKDFKQGNLRDSSVMGPFVLALTEQDMEDLAAFYSRLPRPKANPAKGLTKAGELLYRGGDFEKHIPACIACHGPSGTGNAEAGFPMVSGQQAPYMVAQLQQFKDGKRHNDLNAIMRDTSLRLSVDEMTAVAEYMAGMTQAAP